MAIDPGVDLGVLSEIKEATGLRASFSSRRILVFGALAIAALGVVTVVSRTVWIGSSSLPADDFTQDYLSARAWTHNDNPYGYQREQLPRLVDADITAESFRPEHRNPHSPAEILFIAPLSALPYRTGRVIWLLFGAGATMFAAFAIARSFGWTRPAAAVAGLCALAIPVVGRDLLYGQFGGPLLALIVLAWRDMRSGKEARAGVALGAACALKLFPVFLLIPLIRKRRLEVVLATVATAGVLSIVSMLVIGADASWNWATEVASDNFSFWRGSPVNIALPGLPFRWLTDSFWRTDGPDLVSLAMMIAIGLVILAEFAALVNRNTLTSYLFISSLPWMLLAGPLTGDLSLPILLPFAVFATRWALQQEGFKRLSILVSVAVLAVGIPPGLPSPRPGLSVATLVLGYGLPTIALLVLGITDALRRDRQFGV
jgi:hypothetical protein